MPDTTDTPTPPQARVYPGVVDSGISPLDGFCWPTPPYAAYAAGEPWTQPKACEVVGLNGAARACLLVALDPFDRVAHIQVPPSRVTMPLRFSQFQRIVLDELLAPQTLSAEDDPLLGTPPAVEYRVVLADGSDQSGQTVGHIEASYGLFLFHPTSADGTVRRLFLSRDAYRSIELGPQMLDLLLQDRLVTEQQVEQAVLEQQALRTRKIGEVLVQQKIVSSEQLLLAVEQQARMPMVRLGEALTALGLITHEQLQEALVQQRAERSVSVGELLLRSGRISGDELQSALARKMGYPVVDVDSFPVELLATQRVPAGMARRLNVLPLMLRDGRLMVALEDPTKRSIIEELELVTNTKVAPALAQGARIARRLAAYYPELAGAASDNTAGHYGVALGRAAVTPAAAGWRDAELTRSIGQLLHDGHTRGASAIHLEAQGALVAVRLRIEGQLQAHGTLGEVRPAALMAQMTEWLGKSSAPVAAGWLDITLWPGSQIDGVAGVRATLTGHASQAQVVLQPVMASTQPTLDNLALHPAVSMGLQRALREPRGLALLASCEPSSGRQLRRAVAQALVNTRGKTWLCTQGLELPLTGAFDLPADGCSGGALADALRLLAQADADALVLPEISAWYRGDLLAHAAVQLARDNTLVFASVAACDEAQAIERLLTLGVSRADLADELQLVLVQRPLMRLCPHCRTERAARPDEQSQLRALADRTHGAAPAVGRLFESRGCVQCEGTGVLGMTGLQGAIEPDSALRDLIRSGADAAHLRDAIGRARAHGLAHDALHKLADGQVGLTQVSSLLAA